MPSGWDGNLCEKRTASSSNIKHWDLKNFVRRPVIEFCSLHSTLCSPCCQIFSSNLLFFCQFNFYFAFFEMDASDCKPVFRNVINVLVLVKWMKNKKKNLPSSNPPPTFMNFEKMMTVVFIYLTKFKLETQVFWRIFFSISNLYAKTFAEDVVFFRLAF